MWRHIASNALTFLIVVLFLLAGLVTWGVNSYQAEGPLEEAICLRVESGSNMRRVSERLESQGAISSASIFRLGADYSEKSADLKAGSFLVQPGASMAEIVDQVTASGASTCGTQIVYTIGVARTIARVRDLDPATSEFVEMARFEPLSEEPPEAYLSAKQAPDTEFNILVVEGTTVWQVITSLNALDILEGEIEDLPPEGMLAPDQYEVAPGTDVETLVNRMLAAQAERLADAWSNRVDGLPIETPEEALILASIVEKETGGVDEVRTVASVFENRLRQGMRLQTDPTVIYGVTGGEGVLGRGLRQSELRAETPYNTYVIQGLPPTPIANPGLASIEAVLNPEETDYIFFVAKTLDPADGHNFAVTLEEHNRNVAAYRALEAERDSAN
ncbi:endolytic transglycosylase MltG [Ponticoccus sp. SC2-23]|uniref:endolytic transglycosylase MltG n=1 Tax=Alexandriicola marinus TaxID=2081710 RepID=UPI000FDC16C4|nr:endolytic transglycosylase MltG [Alexandriicola marinus]MBM1222577.1 endolytic transglycosylase MltG [Ponticoccus sp. SC6-9]MBM1227082.1 endolytic transglycosylase MltG [Ponticoccus sp. SC6-15]MBM1231503.1 endolytic transglycosylase MltG [Ponticoccus sp. SC6-38]MBM1236061.1 endolytic transglycosylase MltG [Ponticoccus sp. SC6-45]MBM1240526.1 endolytic transglycosylase MltG [Ponticoccus sp. SC6-49]MBM1245061.1 endolytic transglycosylase MltG [Ponticoccus sp. SC2-64]MBM1249535.1 endolytic t